MSFRKVTATVSCDALEKVESALQAIGVGGISVTKVKGYGEYVDLYKRDWMTVHCRIEVFTSAQRAEKVARTIIDAAHSGLKEDGIVAILPVENLYRIRTRAPVEAKCV